MTRTHDVVPVTNSLLAPCFARLAQDLHMSLGAMYVNMSEETLKSMRRVMPITRSKVRASKLLNMRRSNLC